MTITIAEIDGPAVKQSDREGGNPVPESVSSSRTGEKASKKT